MIQLKIRLPWHVRLLVAAIIVTISHIPFGKFSGLE